MKFTVKVLNLDGRPDSVGDVIEPDGVELKPEPVPVEWGFDDAPRNRMGAARLERRADGVYAEVELNKDWAQDIAGVRLMYPAVGGVTLERGGRDPLHIKRCLVTRIGLSSSKNADPRIPSVGEQLAGKDVPRVAVPRVRGLLGVKP